MKLYPDLNLAMRGGRRLASLERFDRVGQYDYKTGFWIGFVFNVLLLGALIVALAVGCDEAWASEGNVWDAELICSKIYIIEGGAKAVSPYGILSVPCNGYQDCRNVCLNTVENNFTRWQIAGSQGDFLEYLAKKYAPVNSDTDNGTNKFWLSNLRYYLKKD